MFLFTIYKIINMNGKGEKSLQKLSRINPGKWSKFILEGDNKTKASIKMLHKMGLVANY